jgi:pyruvate dehydrogenase (quinone)
VFDEALATPGPAVVEAIVDPFEPPLPAKITVEQARKFAQSLLRGEPNREKIALTVLADTVRALV